MTDQPKEHTVAARAKFQIEFMLMLLMTGRTDEAEQAVDKALALLDEADTLIKGMK